MDEASSRATSFDALLGGKLKVEQPHRGHRAGTDAVLLAAAADLRPNEMFADVGAGVGTVGLAVALREPEARGVLIERDGHMSALAARNVAANGLTDRVTVAPLDLFDPQACGSAGLAGAADLVLTNPPFFRSGSVRRSPDAVRAAAHVLDEREGAGIGTGDWIERCCSLLRPRGRLVVIHRADALPDLLLVFGKRLGDLALMPIHSRANTSAVRLLVGGRRGSRAPLRLLPPLILHEAHGGFTPEAVALHDGVGLLSLWPNELWPNENRPQQGAGLC